MDIFEIFKRVAVGAIGSFVPGTQAAIDAIADVVKLGTHIRDGLPGDSQADLDKFLNEALADMNAAVDRAVKASRGEG